MGLALRRRWRDAGNTARRLLHAGDYWYWLPDDEHPDTIDIAELVHPLRYDIIVRKDFIETYAADRDRFAQDWELYRTTARRHPYRTWYEKIMVDRLKPHLRASAFDLEAAFDHRIRETARVCDSILDDGFDAAHPIVPYAGLAVRPTRTGLAYRQRWYMGDGCHRLATLMAQGRRELPRAWFRIKVFSRLEPIDNTALLEPHLPIEWDPAWTTARNRTGGER